MSLAYASLYVFPLLKAGAVFHAIRSGEAWWIWVIVFVPFGELVYFGMQLMPGGGIAARVVAKKDRRSTSELRYAFEQNPSLTNEVALADRLASEDAFGEAAELYAQALRRDAGYLRAHYGLALCRSGMRDAAGALEHWRVVASANRSYEDYSAWLGLIRDLRALGRSDEALAELDKLVAASPRLAHVVEQCSALAEAGRAAEAREGLQRGLQDHDHAPRHVRRASRAAARKAKELLGELTG
jgi:hypothetical protein